MGYDANGSLVDLHVHSNASDGSCSPEQIVSLALSLGLAAISITDHDTVDGTDEALRLCGGRNIRCISGVEISAAPPEGFPAPGSIHILGYGFSVDDAPLSKVLTLLQGARHQRNTRILERLDSLGIHFTQADVDGQTLPGHPAGRPHIAKLLIRDGYAKDIDDAFERFLGYGKPAYVDKYRVPCDEAVALIRNAGGVPVLAHPGLIAKGVVEDHPAFLKDLIRVLADVGIMGLEVLYPEHDDDMRALLSELASELSLLTTGGSDFHGNAKPEVSLGTGTGDLRVPFSLFTALEKAARNGR